MGKTPENVLVESFSGVLKTARSSACKPLLPVILGEPAAESGAGGRLVFLKDRPHLSSVRRPRQMSHAGVTNSCLVSRTPSQRPVPRTHSRGMLVRAAQPHAPRRWAPAGPCGAPRAAVPGRRWESGCLLCVCLGPWEAGERAPHPPHPGGREGDQHSG